MAKKDEFNFENGNREIRPVSTIGTAIIIHKSQDVSNRNLTNSKAQRLLREAYAIPYSMSPCGFLCWALSEPLFEISMGFMLF